MMNEDALLIVLSEIDTDIESEGVAVGLGDGELVEVDDAPSDFETVDDAVVVAVIEREDVSETGNETELERDTDGLAEAESDREADGVVDGKFDGVLLGLSDLLLVLDDVGVLDELLDLLEVLLGVLEAESVASLR